jgi:type VI secretion system secreted protein VgrG
VILYAKWTALPTYTVTYYANTGTGGVPADSNNYLPGAMVTVLGSGTLTNAGYTFAGWNTQADGNGTDRAPSSTFAMGSANVSLYAKWTSPLGMAAGFAVLGGSTVNNTGLTFVNGNLGVWPGTLVTGFPPGTYVNGTIHAGDAVAHQAQNDLATAYNAYSNLPITSNLTGQDLGGLTLTPGVYHFDSSAQLTGTLKLDAQGNPNALFVFQIGSALTTASNSSVDVINPINSGQSGNVFWQVGSSATLGTGTAFKGNIMALASITITTGASLEGRALAQSGAVTLDTNAIALPTP